MLTEVDWGSPRADSIQIAAESNAACKSLASFKSPSQEHPTTETRRDSAIRRQRVPQLGLRRRLYPRCATKASKHRGAARDPARVERIKHRQRYVGPNAKCARMRNS